MKNLGGIFVGILIFSSIIVFSQVPGPREIIIPPYLKQDFLINSHGGDYGTQQYGLRTASDSLGYTLFVWLDYRNGKKEIMAQFYNPDGTRIGENFKINEGDIIHNNYPVPAVNSKGEFVVVWLKDFETIMGQRLNRSGGKVGSNLEISNRTGMNSAVPGVAVNTDGSFIVMWGSAGSNVYIKYINSSGVPGNEKIIVNEEPNTLSSNALWDNISVDSSGNYFLTWSSYAGTDYSKIFLQKLNSNGTKVGGNILVSRIDDTLSSSSPNIETLRDGSSLILWDKTNFRQSAISCRVLKSDGSFSDEIVLNDEPGYIQNSLSTYKDSLFLLMIDLEFRWINRKGELLGESVPVTGSELLLKWFAGKMITAKNNNILLASSSTDRLDNNIYFQEYGPDLKPAGNYQKINDDIHSSDQQFPYVKFNKQGYALVLWDEGKNGRRDLYAQLYDTSFNPVGGNIQINDGDNETYYLNEKCAESLSDGTFIVAFSGKEPNGVYIQALTPVGIKSGQNLRVGNMWGEKSKLTINVNYKDEIQICWYGNSGAWLKRYNHNLNVIADETQFMKPEVKIFWPLSVSIDTSLTIFSCWRNADYSSTDDKIYGAFYDNNGKMIDNFVIDSMISTSLSLECAHNDSDYVVIYNQGSRYKMLRAYSYNELKIIDTLVNYSFYSLYPRINKFKNRKLFFTYQLNGTVAGMYLDDQADTTQVYYFHSYTGIIGNIYSYDSFYGVYRIPNSADFKDDKLFFTYQGVNSPGKGIDILGNIRQISKLDFGSEEPEVPEEPPVNNIEYKYNLDQNYPNPFNSKTSIKYSLHKQGTVRIRVYNLLGQLVNTILDKMQNEGNYELEFNAAELPSGVYFYNMILESSDNSQSYSSTKKMILLK